MMNQEEFLIELQEVLEEEETLTPETELRALDSFDSLSTLSLIVFAEEEFQTEISTDDFKNIKTVQDLMNLIGTDKFDG